MGGDTSTKKTVITFIWASIIFDHIASGNTLNKGIQIHERQTTGATSIINGSINASSRALELEKGPHIMPSGAMSYLF